MAACMHPPTHTESPRSHYHWVDPTPSQLREKQSAHRSDPTRSPDEERLSDIAQGSSSDRGLFVVRAPRPRSPTPLRQISAEIQTSSAHTHCAHSPARSQTSTASSSASQAASFSRLRPTLAASSDLTTGFSTYDRCRMNTRRTGSAASFSSAHSSSSRSSQHEPEIQLEDIPTLQLPLGTLAPRPLAGHNRTRPSPGVVPAYLVISVINHILFARGALDVPLKLEPMLLGPSTQHDAQMGRERGRAHSTGPSRTTGIGSRTQGRQSKLASALHRLHVDLYHAFHAVYTGRSSPNTAAHSVSGEATVSVLISFGSSPLLPKEYLHIVLRLSGVPPHISNLTNRGPRPTETRSTKSSSKSTDSYFTAASLPETFDPQPPLTPVDHSSSVPPTFDSRPLLKACTALQRKTLRFVVAEDSLQPETFARKLSNRLHVLVTLHSSNTDETPDAGTSKEVHLEGEGRTIQSSDEGDADYPAVPHGWSVRRNTKVPAQVLQVIHRLDNPVVDGDSPMIEASSWPASRQASGSAALSPWRSRSASPFSTSFSSSIAPACVEDQRSLHSSSRAGSESPKLQPHELLAAASPASGSRGSDLTLPQHPHQSESQSSLGGVSTSTALPFASSPLRPANHQSHSPVGDTGSSVDFASPSRPVVNVPSVLKSRLRGGFVLLRKTTSSTFPPPSLPTRGPARSSGGSMMSLSFPSSDGGSEASTDADKYETEGGELADRRPSHGGFGMRTSAKKQVPVKTLVLDLRTPADSSLGTSGSPALQFNLSGEGRGSDESHLHARKRETGQTWWICDTAVPLGR